LSFLKAERNSPNSLLQGIYQGVFQLQAAISTNSSKDLQILPYGQGMGQGIQGIFPLSQSKGSLQEQGN
jgi:hypothetical protein